MKSSLKKLKEFALNKNDLRKKGENRTLAPQEELLQAEQDMLDMRSCYDNLLFAAAATSNSAYEFSEALREMGTCLLEKIAVNDDEGSGRVLLMLGEAQFELQKLVDSYRIHIIRTITTPSESLVKELETVEEMKRHCDDKLDLYESMLAAQREKGKTRSTKGESFSLQQLQAAKEDYEEEANLFIFRLKSLKQGQSRCLLTQAARHHAAQLNFFRKGVKSLELVEPHVKEVAEQQHIDYLFSGLEEDADENIFGSDGNDDGELSSDYSQNDQDQKIISQSRNSMELNEGDITYAPTEISQENLLKSGTDLAALRRAPGPGSQSARILADKFEVSEKISRIQPPSTRKSNTYVLPTPNDAKNDPSPFESDKLVKEIKNQLLSPAKNLKPQSVLKESNINSGPIKLPLPFADESSLPHFNLHNPSDTIKVKRHAYSGPLTSKGWSSKSMFSAPDSVSADEPHRAHVSAQASVSLKVSPNASPPPVLSPRISELHQLPRPPMASAKPVNHSSLVGHSAPLVSRGQEFYTATKRPPIASQKASPLPRPPVVMGRSFSIPSSGQRTPRLTGSKLLAPLSPDMKQASSPPLSPMPFRSNLHPASVITIEAANPKG